LVAKGWALENLKKYNESLKAFDRAIELDPKNPDFWLAKGSPQYSWQVQRIPQGFKSGNCA
jgi:tetratricopeptide (TPR) repeat protein